MAWPAPVCLVLALAAGRSLAALPDAGAAQCGQDVKGQCLDGRTPEEADEVSELSLRAVRRHRRGSPSNAATPDDDGVQACKETTWEWHNVTSYLANYDAICKQVNDGEALMVGALTDCHETAWFACGMNMLGGPRPALGQAWTMEQCIANMQVQYFNTTVDHYCNQVNQLYLLPSKRKVIVFQNDDRFQAHNVKGEKLASSPRSFSFTGKLEDGTARMCSNVASQPWQNAWFGCRADPGWGAPMMSMGFNCTDHTCAKAPKGADSGYSQTGENYYKFFKNKGVGFDECYNAGGAR